MDEVILTDIPLQNRRFSLFEKASGIVMPEAGICSGSTSGWYRRLLWKGDEANIPIRAWLFQN